MKTLKLFLPITVFIALFCIGCGNDTPVNNGNGPGNTDTSFTAYVIITPTGGTADTVYFTDRNLSTGSYSSSQNNTYCILNDTINSNSVSVTFAGSDIGNPAFTFGYISYSGGGLSDVTISGTVILYETVGGKIKGTFSGTFSDGTTSYQCSGVFTCKRTQ